MKRSEIKNLIIRSMESDTPGDAARYLEEEGVSYDFGKGFTDRILEAVFNPALIVRREAEFVWNMNYAFKRIAITGIAAIILLMLSIFLMEGSFSLNSFLGIGDTYDESIICLLTGN